METIRYIYHTQIYNSFPYPCNNNICYPYKVHFPPGVFRLQCWGAQGGNSSSAMGGKGAYTSGVINLHQSMIFYFYIGNSGELHGNQSYNGGGDSGYGASGSGGGATDVRIIGGAFHDFNSLKSRIMVAGGGGGASFYYNKCDGGDGGSLIGYNGFYAEYSPTGAGDQIPPTGGSQVNGGIGGNSFGITSNGNNGTFGIGGSSPPDAYAAGGGAGYYGGGGGTTSCHRIGTGAGGSSYISGHPGCDSISSLSSEYNIQHTGSPVHYNGFSFLDTMIIDGKSFMQSPSSFSEIGHMGPGFILVTVLSDSTIVFCSSTPQFILLFLSYSIPIIFSLTS